MSRPVKRRQGGRGSLNVLVYGLIVVAVLLSGIAVWQRYSQGPRSELGDALEQRIGALMPNLGLIESWTPAGGLPEDPAGAPMRWFVCPQGASLCWTYARGSAPACPFCGLAMVQRGVDQQGMNLSPVAVAGVAGTALPIPIQAGAVRPHGDRGACTNCHTVVRSRAASPGGIVAGAAQGRPVWNGFSTRRVHRLRTGATPAIASGAVKPTLIREFGTEVIGVPGGVKVTGVMGNSFASRAGTTAGDIIIGCNGAKVRDVGQFQQAVSAMVPESNAKIIVLRNGRTRDLSIMVGEGEMEGFMPIQRP